ANEVKTSVDTRVLVRQIVDLLAPPPHISVEIDGAFPQIRAEKTRLSEVFQNLISNAIKYLDKPEGTIRVACQDRDEMWVFSVADNGPGIPEKDFGRIFQLFQTLKPNEGTASTGIGLALVKKIVEGAGGRVWLESKPLQGTNFFFTWPKE
ncbi:MAG: HAMP domain-containing sensor histidine kinase, partial [Coprothermobacterota bacterium]|nr:HAMP domain-containing sensor histidine kinase [Coprothermobacterota bacterium]